MQANRLSAKGQRWGAGGPRGDVGGWELGRGWPLVGSLGGLMGVGSEEGGGKGVSGESGGHLGVGGGQGGGHNCPLHWHLPQ